MNLLLQLYIVTIFAIKCEAVSDAIRYLFGDGEFSDSDEVCCVLG